MARPTIIVASILALLVAAALAFLVPPHLQVRAVRSTLPDVQQLQALAAVRDGPQAVSYVLTSRQAVPGGALGHLSTVIEYEDGRLFVIDAGMDRAAALAFGDTVKSLGVTEDDADFVATLADALGPRGADVAGMGFTHLHIDHTQGVEDFCARLAPTAAVRVHTRTQATEHNFNTAASAGLLDASCLAPRVLDATSLTSVPDFPGIALLNLGGHTPGSTLWAVGLADRVLLFTGDITNSFAEIEQDLGKGLLYSYVFVPEDTNRTGALRQWFRDLDARPSFSIIVSHDLERTRALLPAFVHRSAPAG